jgi:hypothetical protein
MKDGEAAMPFPWHAFEAFLGKGADQVVNADEPHPPARRNPVAESLSFPGTTPKRGTIEKEGLLLARTSPRVIINHAIDL